MVPGARRPRTPAFPVVNPAPLRCAQRDAAGAGTTTGPRAPRAHTCPWPWPSWRVGVYAHVVFSSRETSERKHDLPLQCKGNGSLSPRLVTIRSRIPEEHPCQSRRPRAVRWGVGTLSERVSGGCQNAPDTLLT